MKRKELALSEPNSKSKVYFDAVGIAQRLERLPVEEEVGRSNRLAHPNDLT